ncbi:MAG: alpha/beta fold hydrolase [Betaproteobacteria bacterium]|nr:alpha/beta fold hydrolase [Betaproteobacteria bacterium]
MPEFERLYVRANGVRIHVRHAGEGPAVLLLHGYPQSGIMWRKLASRLAGRYSVVVPDLRGYGESEKPRTGYDKKSMAADMHEVMVALGHGRYAVVGHDRGGRVAHRLALDHPHAVERLSVLDIVPTHTVFRDTDRKLAAAYWHWYYFLVPDLPEVMIDAAPEPFLRTLIGNLCATAGAIEEEAFQEYLRVFRLPGTIRAGLEDYRAAATVDYADDEADLDRRLACPVQCLWGEHGKMHTIFDVVETWRAKALDVRGGALPCGHFIPEEAPEALMAALTPFLEGRSA